MTVAMRELAGKVVVVTGAASGIGRATALAFARAGARAHLVDVDGARLAATGAELAALGSSSEGRLHRLDCSDGAAVEELARAVLARDGRVDVLVNNAGVACAGPLEETPLEDWRWVIGTNLWGVIHGARAFVPRMIAQGGGHLVNVASVAGLVGLPQLAAYCASKFAVVGLTESLAAELGVHGIDVTLVCPGMVRTGILADARLRLPAGARRWIERVMSRRAAEPDEVARAILEAVRRRRYLCVLAGDMLPLWLLKRASASAYAALARRLTAAALRRRGTT